MSVELIVQKIKQDADDKATEIRDEANRKQEVIKQETEQVKKKIQTEAELGLQKAIEKLEAVTISNAKQEINLRLQTAKRALLDSTVQEALQTLYKISSESYTEIMLQACQKEISDFALVNAVEAPADRKDETEKILKTLACKATVTYSNEIPAGLRLLGDDFVIDLTFSSLFANKIDEVGIIAADKLFSS